MIKKIHTAMPIAPTMNIGFLPNLSTVQEALRVKRTMKISESAFFGPHGRNNTYFRK